MKQGTKRIAVSNLKGGTGKTATVVSLAAALGELGQRVLVVDLDPSRFASGALGVKDGGTGLLEVFTEGRALEGLVRPTPAPGVEIVPSSKFLAFLEERLAGKYGRETILRRALDALPVRWDAILVDCPPTLGLLVASALAACRGVLIPVETQTTAALEGLIEVLSTVADIRKSIHPELRVEGILACRVDVRTNLSIQVLDEVRAHYPDDVLETIIRENVRLGEAPSHGKPITLYDTKSTGAEDYRALARELRARWGQGAKGTQPPKGKQGAQRPQQPKGKRS